MLLLWIELQGQLLFGFPLTLETRNTYFRFCPTGHCGQEWKAPTRCCHKIDSANRKLQTLWFKNKPSPPLTILWRLKPQRELSAPCVRSSVNEQIRVALCFPWAFTHFIRCSRPPSCKFLLFLFDKTN